MTTSDQAIRTDPSDLPELGRRRLDIQGLRAIAVLAVVLFHAAVPLPGGFVGVDIFFVVSGFVITGMLTREHLRNGRVNLLRFYVRRFKRLTPALALMITVTMILATFFLSPLGTQQDTSRTGIGAMFLAANLVIAKLTGDYFGLEAETNALLHTWSLSVEEQFYLFFPLLLVLTWAVTRRARRTWLPLIVVAGVGIGSLAFMLLGSAGYALPREDWLIRFYSPLTRIWEFAAGAVLALLGSRIRASSTARANFIGLVGAALLALSLVAITADTPFPGLWTVVPVAGTMAMIMAGSAERSVVERALSTRPLVAIGDWSYSIYLWHWPFIVIASLHWPDHSRLVVPVAAALSFIPAIASYRFVETPLRTMATPSARRFVRVAVPIVLAPLIASTALWQAADRGFGIPQVQNFQAVIFAQPTVGCHETSPLTSDRLRRCTSNAEASGRPVYLLGDSNAGQFGDGLVAAGETMGRPVVINTTNACPFLDVSLTRRDWATTRTENCRRYTQDTLTFLESAPKGLVIISNIDTYWDEEQYAVGTTDVHRSTDRDAKLAALQTGLTRTIQRLRAAGQDVLVVQTIPRWTGEDTWRITGCGVTKIVATSCSQTMSVADAEERQGAVRHVIQRAATETKTSTLDTWHELCPGGTCSTQGPRFPRYYRDGIHVSVEQSIALQPLFLKALRE